MSVSTISYRSPGAGQRVEETPDARVSYSAREQFAELDYVRVHAASTAPRKREPQKTPQSRVLRRLKGFLVETQGLDSRVVFVSEGEAVQYYLPTVQLEKAGITAPNQPFEMDEFEMETDGEGYAIGYRFLALAKPSDVFPDVLELDAERQRKRDLIFKKIGKAQD
jgi:hypothetical protein